MSLKISKKKSVYHLKGEIVTPTAKKFIKYFIKKISKKKKVVLNIDEAKQIDRTGMIAIKQVLSYASQEKKNFCIIGSGCKEIYDDFHQSRIA